MKHTTSNGASRLVMAAIAGGTAIHLTMMACGGVSPSTPDGMTGDAVAHADALAAGAVWSSYTPTITSDGTTPASTLVRGGTIRYVQIDKTVCLQGMVMFGEQSPGTGGTFIRVSVPPGLPGVAGTHQYGIGTVNHVAGLIAGAENSGAGAIEDDVDNFILVKASTSYYADGDAPLGAGFDWIASGCYQTN